MKIINLLRKKNGFTLTELIVALLVMGILFGAGASVYFFGIKHYTRTSDIAYKEGTVTNMETNLQNLLSTATAIRLSDSMSEDTNEYSIGYNDDGCHEKKGDNIYIVELTDIYIQTSKVGSSYSLSYQLSPKDPTMSTLKGGIVMNNIKSESQISSYAEFAEGVQLNADVKKQYLIITGKIISISGDEGKGSRDEAESKVILTCTAGTIGSVPAVAIQQV